MSEPRKPPRRRRTSYVYLTIHSMNGAPLPESFVRDICDYVQSESKRRQVRALINVAGGSRA